MARPNAAPIPESEAVSSLADLQALDVLARLAGRDSPMHRLDARAKLLATGAFVVGVVSVPADGFASLPPFALLWLLASALAGLAPGRLLRPACAALPFALMLGALNPLLDRRPVSLGSWTVAAGWLTLATLLGKALLAAAACTLLAACTEFSDLCAGLARLGLPRAFTQQLLFLWRYLGVLAQEAARMARARDLRSFPGSAGRSARVAARLIGCLLRRALERAQRIHAAMLCRLWSGELPRARAAAFAGGDALFLAAALAATAACRFLPLTAALGACFARLP
jgi:cobalt/nickel transport system permease protein